MHGPSFEAGNAVGLRTELEALCALNGVAAWPADDDASLLARLGRLKIMATNRVLNPAPRAPARPAPSPSPHFVPGLPHVTISQGDTGPCF